MLRKGFLGQLSDWVQEELMQRDAQGFERSAIAFGFDKYEIESLEDSGKLAGMFAEWNVFDCKHEPFEHQTGLEYFIKHNPLGLDEEDIVAYTDLLVNEVGLFAVKEVERGRGVFVESLSTGETHFIHDVNTSLSVQPDETLWARIASVRGLYHAVGCIVLPLPMTMLGDMRTAIRTWEKNSMNTKEMARWLFGERGD
ncbi:MAG: hypothetical protein Q8P93_03655 [bacterium]|nr:hypothetical protein [bacterium]